VSTARLEAMADDVLLAPVAAMMRRLPNPRELSQRVAFGKALWRELVIGFAAQLGEIRLGFTQLAALYAIADGGTTTIADLADALNRSPSATSRIVDGLVKRRLLERREESDDRRMRSVWLTERGRAMVALIDRSRANQFLAIVRPLPSAERAVVAMGVAALASRAVSRRGRLIRQRSE
jgi:DNA-binding MarR family transcriptional regulator